MEFNKKQLYNFTCLHWNTIHKETFTKSNSDGAEYLQITQVKFDIFDDTRENCAILQQSKNTQF
jgi:hypothetical protein